MELTTKEPITFTPPRATTTARKRPADFTLLTLAITATVFTGFWFTYFSPIFAGKYPRVSPLVHLHGWSFFVWYLLLPIQAGLIQTRRVQLHRTLGYASVALASVMVLTGLTVLGVQMRDALTAAKPSFWLFAGPAIFSTMLLFACFYTTAVLMRKKTAWHKRLIVVASSAGMGAATFRILSVAFGDKQWIAPAGIVMTNLFIVAGIVVDLIRERRVHRAWLIGLATCFVVEMGILYSTPTAFGRALSRGLAAIGSALGFLY